MEEEREWKGDRMRGNQGTSTAPNMYSVHTHAHNTLYQTPLLRPLIHVYSASPYYQSPSLPHHHFCHHHHCHYHCHHITITAPSSVTITATIISHHHSTIISHHHHYHQSPSQHHHQSPSSLSSPSQSPHH